MSQLRLTPHLVKALLEDPDPDSQQQLWALAQSSAVVWHILQRLVRAEMTLFGAADRVHEERLYPPLPPPVIERSADFSFELAEDDILTDPGMPRPD